jgi:hypothetical protein
LVTTFGSVFECGKQRGDRLPFPFLGCLESFPVGKESEVVVYQLMLSNFVPSVSSYQSRMLLHST